MMNKFMKGWNSITTKCYTIIYLFITSWICLESSWFAACFFPCFHACVDSESERQAITDFVALNRWTTQQHEWWQTRRWPTRTRMVSSTQRSLNRRLYNFLSTFYAKFFPLIPRKHWRKMKMDNASPNRNQSSAAHHHASAHFYGIQTGTKYTHQHDKN